MANLLNKLYLKWPQFAQKAPFQLADMIRSALASIKALFESDLPYRARLESDRDRLIPKTMSPDDSTCNAVLDWLCRAQDLSPTNDGGVARHFSLISGWGSSYPETTGYIIPTFLSFGVYLERPDLHERARRMLDWLASIQLEDGSFQGGMIDQTPVRPVTFNTGQILLGLAAGVTHLGSHYRAPMNRAARWLVETQDSDGAWRKYPSPFTGPGLKAYETHVAWGLLEAARLSPNQGFEDAAMANIQWSLTNQRSNGWFENCDLNHAETPLTHTIGYVLRGMIEGVKYFQSDDLLEKSERTAKSLLGCVEVNGYIPGRLDSNWRGAVEWSCLTGSAQIASCWYDLYMLTNNSEYLRAANLALSFVASTISLDPNDPDVYGGVKGSFPVDGDYGKFEYLNWAGKFFLDAYELKSRADQYRSAESTWSESAVHPQ